MAEQLSKLQAVQLARIALGGADSEAIAAYVEAHFGMRMKPAIVKVLLASLRERETLEQNRRKARRTGGGHLHTPAAAGGKQVGR